MFGWQQIVGIPVFLWTPTTWATKICRLETRDAKGVIGYSGVGASVRRGEKPFELSKWIARTLTGMNLTLNETLYLIGNAASKRNLHLLVKGHSFIFAGFENGIPCGELITSADTLVQNNYKTNTQSVIPLGNYKFNRSRCNVTGKGGVWMSIDGSGRQYVRFKELKKVNKLAKKAHRSHSHANRVNAFLAQLIRTASYREKNQTVSPECLTVCILPDGTSWSKSFDESGAVTSDLRMPCMARGLPVHDLVRAVLPTIIKHLDKEANARLAGTPGPELDADEMNKLAGSVRDTPDDTFPS